MTGNIGKVKIWTPINMADPKLVANHRVKAWLQERRDNWLVYRNNYITLGSAKIAAPKTNKAVTHPSDDIRMSLSALSQRFDHKDPSQNKAAQTGALTAIGEYFKKNPFEFESGINHLVDNLSANQLQQLRKNSAALLEGTELKSLLHGKDEEETEKIIGFLTEVHNRCDSTLMLKKGFNHHELSPAPHELSPAPQVGGVHSDSESSEVKSSNSDDNENSSNYSEVDNSPSVAPPPQLDEPPPFPSTLPLAKDKPAGGFPEMVPNDKTTPTVKTKPTPATSFKGQVVRQRLQSSLDPKLQKRSGEPQSRRPSSPPLGPLTPDEFDSQTSC